MEPKKTPQDPEATDSKNAFQVLFAVAVGLGLVLILGVVQGIEKCARGAARVRNHLSTWLRSFESKGRIQNSETDPISSASSSH